MTLYKFRSDNGMSGTGEIDQIIFMIENLFGLQGDVSYPVRNMDFDNPVQITGVDYINGNGNFATITIYKVG